MDWSDCSLVESVPGKGAGKPVVKGTRIPADTVVIDFELGSPVEKIHENFPTLPIETIKKLLAFAQSRQLVP